MCIKFHCPNPYGLGGVVWKPFGGKRKKKTKKTKKSKKVKNNVQIRLILKLRFKVTIMGDCFYANIIRDKLLKPTIVQVRF